MTKQKPQPEILDWAQLQIRRHDAAVAMLAALKIVPRPGSRLSLEQKQRRFENVAAAIAQAEAAGIKAP